MRRLVMSDPSQMSESEQIAQIAYRIYEEEGHQEGKAAEHWARAERIIHEQRMAVTEQASGPCPDALDPPHHMVP